MSAKGAAVLDGRHETPLAPRLRGGRLEDDDRLEAVIVMEGIEQAQLLAAVHAVEEPAPAKAGASSISSRMRLGACRNKPQYCATSARPRRSSARTSGRFSSREIPGSSPRTDCEHNSSSEGNRSSANLNIASRRSVSASLPSSYPAAILSQAVHDLFRSPRVLPTGGPAIGQSQPALDLAQHQQSSLRGQPAAIKAGDHNLALNR